MKLTDKAMAARRAYKREWARRNPEKVQEYQRRFWERMAAAADNEPAQPRHEKAGGND